MSPMEGPRTVALALHDMDRNDNRVQLRGGRRSIADAKDVTGIGDVQLRVLQARCVKRGRHFTAAGERNPSASAPAQDQNAQTRTRNRLIFRFKEKHFLSLIDNSIAERFWKFQEAGESSLRFFPALPFRNAP